MKDITILVPSRNARASVGTLIESWENTTNGKSDIVIGIDDDQLYNYSRFMWGSANFLTMEPMKLVPKLNEMAKNYPKAEIIGFVGDDVVFQTPGWEWKIIDWQRENKGICYCNDLLQGKNLPNNVFIHREVLDGLGFMAPPVLQHYYIDNYWIHLGVRLLNVNYFPDIIMEHRHWSNGKAEKDDLYKESELLVGADHKAYDNYLVEGKLHDDVIKVLSYKAKLELNASKKES